MKLQARLASLVLSGLLSCLAPRLEAQNSFTTLQDGFTQTLYGNAPIGSSPIGLGGIAFAPNGDVWADHCSFFATSSLTRFVSASTVDDGHGGSQHPQAVGSPFPSAAGCGLTNHPDGTLYSNVFGGVVNLDANTGVRLRPNFGPGGDSLGITVDPQTNNLVYVGLDCLGTTTCSIYSVNPLTTAVTYFAQFTTGQTMLVDGIAFDPSGNFLFLSIRTPTLRMGVLDRTGTLVQAVPLTSEPDGIAFHVNPYFVVTNNTDGTMTRFDFPSNNFTLPPTQTVFAAGGFRGDLAQVGPDGCLYATQNATRFSDNTVSTTDSSIVQICPNFVPPPGVNPAPGRMTGGGSVFVNGSRVTHGLELQCNIKNAPNNLEVNWGLGNNFHLDSLSAVVCYADPTIDEKRPKADFNTLIGSGSGRFNGVPGATVKFTFSDAGEPGRNDFAKIEIEAGGVTVLSVSGNLDNGNQQAHAR